MIAGRCARAAGGKQAYRAADFDVYLQRLSNVVSKGIRLYYSVENMKSNTQV